MGRRRSDEAGSDESLRTEHRGWAMDGLMMDWPLVIPNILRRAARYFPEKEIVSRWGDGTLHRMTYRDLEFRVHRLMNVLRGLGIQPGDRVATFAWNHHRHLELYFAVPSM